MLLAVVEQSIMSVLDVVMRTGMLVAMLMAMLIIAMNSGVY